MIKLTFKQYIDKLAEEKKIRIPTEHVFEGIKGFLLFFKSRENWEYCTYINNNDILEFSSIEDFKLNYCYNCLPVAESPIFIYENVCVEEETQDIKISTFQKLIDLEQEELVKNSKTYSEFLYKLFKLFEKKTLSAVEKIKLDKKLNKDFGKFVSNLFNIVNTSMFARNVKKIIKITLNDGKKEAEKETQTELKFNNVYSQKLEQLYQQQINGYTINGKKWFGIKGITREIQQKIIQTVQEGINNNKNLNEIKNEIKSVYENFSDNRSMLIARTESNRILNKGKILGYKQSGVEGVKVWVAVPYEKGRSSEICRRLNGQEVELDDLFIDPGTMKAYNSPPAHPNCRSRIVFKSK